MIYPFQWGIGNVIRLFSQLRINEMKLKEDLNIDILLKYGFEKIDKGQEEEDENYTLSSFDYKFEIGHARRGQFYYLLVSDKPRNIIIYASEPDGGGGSIGCPDVLIKLVEDGIVS